MGGTGTGNVDSKYVGMPAYNDEKREGKLVELVDENLDPLYKFSRGSLDFRNPPKEKGSDLVYMTFRDFSDIYPDANDIKHKAMKAFERDYKEMGVFLKGFYQDHSIKDQHKNKEKGLSNLEKLKAKNFYNPRRKDGLKPIKIIGGGIALGFGGATLMEAMEPSRGIPFMAAGLVGMEVVRRGSRSDIKEDIKEISQNIEFYDNFKRNIENARVSIVPVEESKEIYNKIKNFENKEFIDFDKVNENLKQAYGVL